MFNLFIFFLNFKLILFSILGYGFIFNKIFFRFDNSSLIGFIGLSVLTFYGLLSSIFIIHDYFHNILIIVLGILLSFYFIYKNQKNLKLIKHIFFLSLILFPTLITSGTHNDFNYYHLPFTKYLTENKVIFGMGHANHGYNYMSSLFYLNSLFIIPFTNFFSLHFSNLYFLIFFNYFLLLSIFQNKKIPFDLKFLSFLSFLFFNIVFFKIHEFGTDLSGQLLIVILFLYLLSTKDIMNIQIKLENYRIFIFLLIFALTLKTIFLPYFLLIFIIFYDFFRLKKSKQIFNIFFTKLFFIYFLYVFVNYFHHFAHTGCIVSPIEFTCLKEFSFWSVNHVTSGNLASYTEFWAKGGVGLFKNVTYEIIHRYNSDFNWLKHFAHTYLFGNLFSTIKIGLILILISIIVFYNFELPNKSNKKNNNFFLINLAIIFFSSALLINYLSSNFLFNSKILLIIFFISLIIIFVLKFTNKNYLFFDKFYLLELFILLVLFLIWFNKHPQLRYGGYIICYFVGYYLIYPFLKNFFSNRNVYLKNSLFICIFVLLGKIILSLNYMVLYKKSFDNFPYYNVIKPSYKSKKYYENFSINYAVSNFCGITPSICAQRGDSWIKNISVKKIKGYYFIIRDYD